MNPLHLSHPSVIAKNVFSRQDFDAKLSNSECVDRSTRYLDLDDFDAKKFIKDKRVLKAVSHRDSYAIAAIEQIKNFQFNESVSAPEKRGLFVGACPSSVKDYDNYVPSVARCIDSSGHYIEKYFGRECMTSRPTTLLLGLPNNVLCYGSMLLDARGPNNNFVSEGVSSAQALQSARRSLLLNRLTQAYVGGYSEQSDSVKMNTAEKLGHTIDRTFADGAAFVSMSKEASEESIEYFGTVFRSAKTYLSQEFAELALESVQKLMEMNDLQAEQVGLVFVPETKWLSSHSVTFKALSNTFANENTYMLSLDQKFGYVSEISTMIEIAAIESINSGRINEVLIKDQKNISCMGASTKFKIVLSSSLDGDIAASLFR